MLDVDESVTKISAEQKNEIGEYPGSHLFHLFFPVNGECGTTL